MEKFNLEEFIVVAKRIREKAIKENRLIDNPSDEELKKLVERQPGIKKTIYGNLVFNSEPSSRVANFTKNSIDHSFGKEEIELLRKCEEELSKEELISLDRVVGEKKRGVTVRLICPKRFAHIAYGGGNLYLPVQGKVENPTYYVVVFTDGAFKKNKSKPLPEKDITIRLAFLSDERMVKIVRNSTYIGEYKKGVFAGEDWNRKEREKAIFLHSGCRLDHLQSTEGEYRQTVSLLLALSANGKTTLTSKILARKSGEESWLIQDDGGALLSDGSFEGYEGGGIYVKTEGVNPGNQSEIYYGLLKPDAFAENVWVDENGKFDFYNYKITSNGRATVRRKDFMHANQSISIDKVDNIILITRGPIIPAISKLTPEEAVGLMILGQAMESSAGDPTQVGKVRSEFFYDPFVVGDRAKHANRFYEIIKGLPHLKFYLINTGGIGGGFEGENYYDITPSHTLSILDSLFRGGLKREEDWIPSPTGFKVPKAVRGVDPIYFYPEKLYSKRRFEKEQESLNKLRQESIEKLGPTLYPEIKKVFKK